LCGCNKIDLLRCNAWLKIPLADYKGHMSLPAVGQAQMIADQFDRALDQWAPTSLAVIGCAGGNGLDRIASSRVKRVIALDVNPDYIERTRARYARRLEGLDLICADVQSESLVYDPVDFTYAALLFEYVDVQSTLKTLKRNSRPGAVLTTVLQRHDHRAGFREEILCAELYALNFSEGINRLPRGSYPGEGWCREPDVRASPWMSGDALSRRG